MVRVPNFRLLAKGVDITEKIQKNLINLSYEDKEGHESDEISFVINGIYEKPFFGDSLELWLGYVRITDERERNSKENELYHCGKFSVQTASMDYKAWTTEVRATAVNFASEQKVAKRRSWENTGLFDIASKIANENNLAIKTSGENQPIKSVLQDNVSDLDFLYSLCFEYGYLMKVANETIVITNKDGKSDDVQSTAKNKNLPAFKLPLNQCEALQITQANRNSYSAVIVQWHDTKDGADKQLKIGSDGQCYKMNIPEPKSDNEAFKKGEAKLNELRRGGTNGHLSTAGREIRAGGRLKITGVSELDGAIFSVKSVSHRLDSSGYMLDVEIEG